MRPTAWYISFMQGCYSGHIEGRMFRSTEKSSDLIGNRNRELPACSCATAVAKGAGGEEYSRPGLGSTA